MATTWTRIETRQPRKALAAIKADVDRIFTAAGQRGVEHIQRVIWPVARFKRPTGLSTRSWSFKRADWGGHPAVLIENTAERRGGVKYARYVHLSGRPKSDLLIREVQSYTLGPLAAEIAKATAEALIERAPAVTSRVVLKG